MTHASVTPRRIVCLTEETTETLYLLGEQDRVVGISGFTELLVPSDNHGLDQRVGHFLPREGRVKPLEGLPCCHESVDRRGLTGESRRRAR